MLLGSLTLSCALQVNQGNMPGIQSTFLAMDTEEGVEVVWNELLFTDKKAFKAHEVSHLFPLESVPPAPCFLCTPKPALLVTWTKPASQSQLPSLSEVSCRVPGAATSPVPSLPIGEDQDHV